jgi:hypothetical protein
MKAKFEIPLLSLAQQEGPGKPDAGRLQSLAGWVPFTTGGIAIVDARETAKVTEGERQVTELPLPGLSR